jgi:hypothetical protein
MTWTSMRETNKPESGFIYTCEHGHEWFLPLAVWEDRGPNICVACKEAAGDAEPGQPG